jgi:hypothetical protein
MLLGLAASEKRVRFVGLLALAARLGTCKPRREQNGHDPDKTNSDDPHGDPPVREV